MECNSVLFFEVSEFIAQCRERIRSCYPVIKRLHGIINQFWQQQCVWHAVKERGQPWNALWESFLIFPQREVNLQVSHRGPRTQGVRQLCGRATDGSKIYIYVQAHTHRVHIYRYVHTYRYTCMHLCAYMCVHVCPWIAYLWKSESVSHSVVSNSLRPYEW